MTTKLNNKEIYKPVLGYEGYYKVSNFGNVKSLSRKALGILGSTRNLKERILAKRFNHDGYSQVYLGKNNIFKGKMVHRLLAEVFIENPLNKKQINHKDGIKDNNNINNLEWCTPSENIIHSFKVLKRKGGQQGKLGKNHPTSKPIIQMDLCGKILKIWNCRREITEAGISAGNISHVLYDGYNQSGGYKWKLLVQ